MHSTHAIQHAMEQAAEHHRRGRLAEAEKIYREVLAQSPNHPVALGLLGAVAHQTGNSAIAEELIERSVRLMPSAPGMWNNLGLVRIALKKYDAAREALEAARRADPNHVPAINNLATALWLLGRTEESMSCLARVLELEPKHPEALSNMADLLLERGQIDESLAMHRRAIEVAPNSAKAYNNYAKALIDVDPVAAAAAFGRAIELDPTLATAMTNFGLLRAFQGYPTQAIQLHQRALALHDGPWVAHQNLGTALLAAGRVHEAIATLRRACALDRGNIEAHDNLLWALLFDEKIAPAEVSAEFRNWGRLHADPLMPPALPTRHRNDRLRIGYVSGDFRDHAAAHFIAPVLAAHDRSRVEIFCYSTSRQSDGVTARMRSNPLHWRELAGRSDDASAQMIRQDRIDVLIDLSGHSAHNRLPIFARRPAPVQVTWLGYPNTTGMSAIDYWITDAHLDPPQSESLATEKLVRLPRTFTCYQPPEYAPAVVAAPAIAAGYVTFGSFNMVPKMNDRVLALWARVLNAVERSRLLIIMPMIRDVNVHASLLERFAALGVARERLDIRPAQEPADYLRTHGEVDIVLDTFPFTGHTVTLHALWMGCPVVTLTGNTHISRRGVSVMHNLGLPELIAADEEAYVWIANELAEDLNRLSNLRATLRQRMQQSPLLDAAGFTRELEDVLINSVAE